MTSLDQPFRECIHYFLPQTKSLYLEILAMPSLRSQTAPVQNRLSNAFADLGMEIRKVRLSELCARPPVGFSHPKENYADSAFTDEYSFEAKFAGLSGKKKLVLGYHVDVAPPGPIEAWETNPFVPHLVGETVYARGAWDDKAGAALAFLFSAALARWSQVTGKSIPVDLHIQSVTEDEYTGNGTLSLLQAGTEYDAAIILDGAYGPFGVVAHPGYLNFELKISGKAAPSCRSDLGVNAIEKTAWLILKLRQHEQSTRVENEYWNSSGRPIQFNPGVIKGGDWTGTVPTECRVECQWSFLPPLQLNQAQDDLRSLIGLICQDDPWLKENPPSLRFFDLNHSPFKADENDIFYPTLSAAVQSVMGQPIKYKPVTGWCDLRHFNIKKKTPGCLFGPGRGANAHRPNEYFDFTELTHHAEVLFEFVQQWGLGKKI